MPRVAALSLAWVFVFGVGLPAQDPVIKRSAPMTLTGEIVDISCYKEKGVAGGTGAAEAAAVDITDPRGRLAAGGGRAARAGGSARGGPSSSSELLESLASR